MSKAAKLWLIFPVLILDLIFLLVAMFGFLDVVEPVRQRNRIFLFYNLRIQSVNLANQVIVFVLTALLTLNLLLDITVIAASLIFLLAEDIVDLSVKFCASLALRPLELVDSDLDAELLNRDSVDDKGLELFGCDATVVVEVQ